jgi:hypothetical protein
MNMKCILAGKGLICKAQYTIRKIINVQLLTSLSPGSDIAFANYYLHFTFWEDQRLPTSVKIATLVLMHIICTCSPITSKLTGSI